MFPLNGNPVRGEEKSGSYQGSVLGPRPNGHLHLIMVNILKPRLDQPILEQRARIRFPPVLPRGFEKIANPFIGMVVGGQASVARLIHRLIVLEFHPAAWRRVVIDILNILPPIRYRRGHIAGENKIKRGAVDPEVLDIVYFEGNVW